MGFKVAAGAAVLAAATMWAQGAAAQDAMTPTGVVERSGFGSYADRMEIRFGGMLYDRGLFSPDEYSGAVVNGEFLFRSPGFLDVIGSPRPYVGFDAAIADDPIHFFYAGLNWDYNLTHRLYLSGSVGGAITTADNLENPTTYKALGSRVLFHLGFAIGFDVTDNLTAQIYADHFSNAGLGDPNDGAESTGIRIGYRF